MESLLFSTLTDEVRINKRAVRDFFGFGIAAYATLWTFVESFGSFFTESKPEGALWYVIIIVLSILFGLWICWPKDKHKKSINIQIPGSDSSFEIKFGDIFEGSGAIVIPVNEYFDSLLGDHVSEKSLHGKFITDVLGGQSETFERRTSESLESTQIKPTQVQRKSGRTLKYPIGTVAKIDTKDRRFLLAALTKTNIETLKASATSDELWDCLAGIWKGIRDYHNGNLVKIPLIGSGLSGVGLPPKVLIGIIITSFFYYTKGGKIADKITLVLPARMKGNIDLTTIERSWH